MEIVDVNVSKFEKYNMEYEYDFESLWYSMFDDGTYTQDGCYQAVGFIYSNACHAEVYGNSMDVRWIKDNSDNLRLAMVANDLVNNLMGTEQKKIITEETTEPRSLLTMAYILTSSSISRSVTFRFSLTRKPKKPSSEGTSINQLKLKI